MKRFPVAACVTVTAISLCVPAMAEPSSFFLQTTCRKNDTAGCNGNDTQCFKAPPDRIIMRSSMKMDINPSGRSPRCEVEYGELKKIAVTAASGMKFDVEEPQQFCVKAHIESGSGPGNLGKGFNVKCTANFQMQETE